jgi:hypothetical protein
MSRSAYREVAAHVGVHDGLIEDHGAVLCDTGQGTAPAVPRQLQYGRVQVDAEQQL